MKRRELKVKGSAKQPYILSFEFDGDSRLHAYCNCDAGKSGQYCKHRFGVLDGSTLNVVEGAEYVPEIAAWYAQSQLKGYRDHAKKQEKSAEKAKREYDAIVKQIRETVAQDIDRGQPEHTQARQNAGTLTEALIAWAEQKYAASSAWTDVAIEMMHKR